MAKSVATRVLPTSAKISDLEVKHPYWKQKNEIWTDLRILFEGGEQMKAHAARFLRMRPKEPGTIYSLRTERITYQNILGSAIGWYVAFMFNEKMSILFEESEKPTERDFYKLFLKNVDKKGTTIQSFAKEMLQELCLYGCSITVIDKPYKEPGVTYSKQQTADLGLDRVFLVKKCPIQMINWNEDEDGNLEWALFREFKPKMSFLGDSSDMLVRWTYFDKTQFGVWEAELEGVLDDEAQDLSNKAEGATALLVKSGPHALSAQNKVPVLVTKFSKDFWIGSRAYLSLLSHLNSENALDWALFMSAMAIPVVFSDSEPTMNQTEASYIMLPRDAKYEWTEPEGKSFQHLADRIESIREESYRSMYLMAQGRSMSATPAMQSGRSKKLDMMPSKDIAGSMGTSLKDSLTTLADMIVEARGETGITTSVVGFEFYETMSSEDLSTVKGVLSLKIGSETFEKFLETEVARLFTVNSSFDLFTKIKEEIEASPSREERGADQVGADDKKQGSGEKGVTIDRVADDAAGEKTVL